MADPEGDSSPSEGGRVLDFPGTEGGAARAAAPDADGAWADDAPAKAEESVERLLQPAKGGEVVEFPGNSTTQKRRRPAFADPSRKRAADAEAEPEAPKRPAFLASELLEIDWWPEAPLARTLRVSALVLGLGGAVAVLGLGGLGLEAIALGALLAACAAAGAAPIKPSVRGPVLAGLGAAGAALVGWQGAAIGSAPAAGLLLACVVVTSSALLFRAAHRQSKLARALVGVGLTGIAAWLVLSGGIDALIVESLSWQAWLGPASRALLGLVALAAVLTFLDPSGHGGAWGVAFALLVWLALETGSRLAVGLMPLSASASAIDLTSPQALGVLAQPLLCALAAGGLCQVWVDLSRRGRAA